jgi:osmotically-inducible protein OsmY
MPIRTDAEIQHDVLDELTWDAAVDARQLGVSVARGVATITGQVRAYSEKREAGRLAEMIPGVSAVIVNIDVQSPDSFSDAEIRGAIRQTLAWASYLPEGAVDAQVDKGWVTLSGKVAWGFQRQNAEHAVRYMKGVKGLTNAIAVGDRSAPADRIKADIETALTRRYDAEDQHIQVSVEDRVVTLSGTVTNWWQRYRTRKSAWNAAGVEDVHDDLRVVD